MNDIRILPLYFYPFNRTQNQVMNSSLFEQDVVGNSGDNSINYQFNYRLGKAMPYNDSYVLSQSPSILGNTPLGEMTFDINLSQDSFSTLFGLDRVIKDKTLYDIKMLVFFKDYNNVSTGINKYFYYVEQVKRVNANNFTFTLSLDVFKTYYNDVMEIKGLRPERYFIPSNDLIRTATEYEDDLFISGGLEIGANCVPKYEWNNMGVMYNSTNSVNTFEYFFIKGDDKRDEYFTENYDVMVIQNKGGNNNDLKRLRNRLYNYSGLVKVITSIISPADDEISDSNNFAFTENESTLLDIPQYPIDIGYNSYMLPLSLVEAHNKDLYDYLSLMQNSSIIGYVFIKDLSLPVKSPLYTANGDELIYNGKDLIDVERYKSGFFNGLNIKPLLSIGFINEPKKLIPLYSYVIVGVKLELSLFDSKDTIYFNGDDNIESDIERSIEYNNPKLTDAYEQYLLNNKNALTQKELELGKYATRNTITRGLVGTITAGLGIAGAMFTGGGSIAVAGSIIAGGMSGYNMIDGLGKNARARAMHKAELQDKKGVIENFTPSNYNENMDADRMLPIIRVNVKSFAGRKNFYKYNEDTNILDFLKLGGEDNLNTENLKRYGIRFTGLGNDNVQTLSVNNMMTRKHYNYIEVNDVMNATQNGNIPNNLYSHILDVLQNGITFSTIDYILNSNLRNEEV